MGGSCESYRRHPAEDGGAGIIGGNQVVVQGDGSLTRHAVFCPRAPLDGIAWQVLEHRADPADPGDAT
jgi:hypothetical protein